MADRTVRRPTDLVSNCCARSILEPRRYSGDGWARTVSRPPESGLPLLSAPSVPSAQADNPSNAVEPAITAYRER